jgi:hypothetical protein
MPDHGADKAGLVSVVLLTHPRPNADGLLTTP